MTNTKPQNTAAYPVAPDYSKMPTLPGQCHPNTPLENAMAGLTSGVSELSTVISQLRDKLEPVRDCRPTPASSTDSAIPDPAPFGAALLNAIHYEGVRVRGEISVLLQLLNELEV